MNHKKRKIILKRIACLVAVLCFYVIPSMGQDRFTLLDEKLTEKAKTIPGLDQKVETSVNGVSIQEFIRGKNYVNCLKNIHCLFQI